MTTDPMPLTERVRTMLAGEPSSREISMFGGLSFMVNERMVVAVGSDGDLLVRVDPERGPELVTLPGARPAEMGAGRAMGPSWISVADAAVGSDEQLSFWLRAALEHNGRAARGAR